MSTFQLQSVKRFYFLEYFYVLLKSISKNNNRELAFESFKDLKHEHLLGESKYKKLSSDQDKLSRMQVNRYFYTFNEVIEESKLYDLIEEDSFGNFIITDLAKRLLTTYEKKGAVLFNLEIFKLMESRHGAFKYLCNFLYNANKHLPGLLIFPVYSPRQLKFERSEFRTTKHIIAYSIALYKKLEQDITRYIGQNRKLKDQNNEILLKLMDSSLMPKDEQARFDPSKYNVITKRFRDFWINYFLRKVYVYKFSLSSFDIWIYRGKQIGIIYASEFFPNFNGKIVYPTSVVMRKCVSLDFEELFEYKDGTKLYIHNPDWEKNQNLFLKFLIDGYIQLKKFYRTYFIDLAALREIVCYNMKISEFFFEQLLEKAYKLNLSGELKIKISLEVDKLPEETKAMYLKKAPVMVDGKFRNIIAINVTEGG